MITAIPIIGDLIKGAFGIVDQLVLDKDKANELKVALQQQAMSLDYEAYNKEIEAKAQILVAEIKNESWLTRSWRPLLMLVIITIIFNNYVLAPYIQLVGAKSIMLELPERMWDLLSLGVTGYVLGRSAEKLAPTVVGILKGK